MKGVTQMVEQQAAPFAQTVAQVAVSLGLSERKVWEIVKSGQLDSRRVGTRVLILRSSLLAFLESRPSAATAPRR